MKTMFVLSLCILTAACSSGDEDNSHVTFTSEKFPGPASSPSDGGADGGQESDATSEASLDAEPGEGCEPAPTSNLCLADDGYRAACAKKQMPTEWSGVGNYFDCKDGPFRWDGCHRQYRPAGGKDCYTADVGGPELVLCCP
jgi:hypothetical protein